MKISEEIEVVSSGISAFDKLLGCGGYPKQYLTMISGQAGVGKTTLAIHAIREAQKAGLKTLYVETDYKFVPKYFRQMGVAIEQLTVIQGEVGEDILSEMIKEIETGKYGFVILDTVSKLTPREEVEKDFDSHTIGKQAMLIGRFLRKLKPLANQHNLAVLLLNHEREDIMSGYGKPSIKTPGGKAIQEDVVIWVRMSHTGENIKQNGVVVGKTVKAKIWRKNQVAPTEGHEALLEVYSGQGFMNEIDQFESELEAGIIVKTGNTYTRNGEKIAVGKDNAKEWLRVNSKF